MSAGPDVLKPIQEEEPETTELCPFCMDTMQDIDGYIICLTCGWVADNIFND